VFLRILSNVVLHEVHVRLGALNCTFKCPLRTRLVIVADHQSKHEVWWKVGAANVRGKPSVHSVVDADHLEMLLDGFEKTAMNAAFLEIVDGRASPLRPERHMRLRGWHRRGAIPRQSVGGQ
jgi:hypothetical protein